jgi:hypothetical protein
MRLVLRVRNPEKGMVHEKHENRYNKMGLSGGCATLIHPTR